MVGPENGGPVLAGLKKMFVLLDRRGRRQMKILLCLSMTSAALEMAGVTSMLPFMALATNPDMLGQPGRLHQLYLWARIPSRETFLVCLGGAVLGALTLSNLVVALSLWYGYRFTHEQQKRMSLRLLQSFLGQSYDWHIRHHHIALGHSLAQARALVESNFRPLLLLLTSICSVAFLVSTLFYFTPLATLGCLGGLAVIYGGVYIVCRRALIRASTREWHLAMEMGRTVSEPLGGIKHVKLAAMESAYFDQYSGQLGEQAVLQRAKLVSTEVPRLVMQTLTYGLILGLVIYLVSRYGGGSAVVARASLFALAGYRLIPGVQQIFLSLAQLESGRYALDQLFEHLQTEPPPLERPPAPLPIQESISLENVTFGYGDFRVFENLNLVIPRHACIGLVGPTGRGKTTLVNLLVGLLTPQEGHLMVDGTPLSGASLRSYGRNIGYVPQDVYLSDDSILSNIGMGAEQLDREAAIRAAVAARVDEFALGLPNGYETHIGERGIRLSGGQRQRIGIARALYRNPEVLVLDEATSALDGGTEAQVMNAIQELAHSKTIIIVAHRLSTVMVCDTIYLVGHGGIVASGTFRELSETCPEFQALQSLG